MLMRLSNMAIGLAVAGAGFAAIGLRSLASPLAIQIETQEVAIEDLAFTPPLPFASEPTTVSLERIVVAPNASMDETFSGPVLFYIEQGTLNVNVERNRVAIVQTDDQKQTRSDQKVRGGNIPAGYGVYSADGNPGRLQNVGSDDLVLLAVLFVPQPMDAGQAVVVSATAVAPAASPSP